MRRLVGLVMVFAALSVIAAASGSDFKSIALVLSGWLFGFGWSLLFETDFGGER